MLQKIQPANQPDIATLKSPSIHTSHSWGYKVLVELVDVSKLQATFAVDVAINV
jgi:hypothetical protein